MRDNLTATIIASNAFTNINYHYVVIYTIAGKTYTMIGRGPSAGIEKGIRGRSITRLFEGLNGITKSHIRVSISYLQIHCETLQVLYHGGT